MATLAYLPATHLHAFETYVRALSPTTFNPHAVFHSTLLALQSTIDAILSALSRPPRLINQINASRRTVERNYSSLSRSTRWPLGLLDDTRQRLNEEREERMRAGQAEVDNLSRELRYTQQTVAMELAGWQDLHEKMGRRAIRELARGMVVVEKMRLEGMRRALRKLKKDVKVEQRPRARTLFGTEPGAGSGQRGIFSEVDTTAGREARGFSSTAAPLVLAGLEIQADRKTGADPPLESGRAAQNSAAAWPEATGSRIDALLPASPPGEATGSSWPPE